MQLGKRIRTVLGSLLRGRDGAAHMDKATLEYVNVDDKSPPDDMPAIPEVFESGETV